MSNSLQLGQPANLLYGFQPAWNPNGSVDYPFFAPSVASTNLYTPDFVAPTYPGWSGYPVVTLHTSAMDLLSAVYKYNVMPMALDPAGASVPVGPLALGDADSASALQAAGTFLGLDLTVDQSYMLVVFESDNGTATHPFVSHRSQVDRSKYLTHEALAAIVALKAAAPPVKGSVLYDSKLTTADASAYLQTIYNLGTHFVSQITQGDRLIQVFTYDAAHFQTIQKAFASDATEQPDGTMAVSGPAAVSWAYYTSQVNGSAGFVTSYGQLVAISQDPALATAIQAGSWANGYVPDGTASIFAGALNGTLLTPLVQSVPTVLSLTPIADLISDLLVAGPWDRLVVGGLLQKYGSNLEIPLRREIDYDWATLFPQTDDSWTSNIVTPTIDIYQERVDLAKVTLMGGDLVSANYTMNSFTAFAQVIEATTAVGAAPIPLPSDNITIIAQIIDMTGAAQTPVLTMSTKAFGQFTVVCEDMYGALIFEDASTSQRKVALDGFLFQTNTAVDPTTQRYVVGLAGVLSDAPTADQVTQVKQSIEFSVVAGESLLQAQGTDAKTVRKLEQSYLLWLASLIPADTTDADLSYNRARALYLAHNVGTFSSDAVVVPYVTYSTYTAYVGDLVTEANAIQSLISSYETEITDTVNSYKVMNSIADLNDNVKQIGGVLTKYYSDLAAGNASMGQYYDSIIAQLNQQSQQTLDDINDLTTKLQAQQTALNSTSTPPGIIQQFQQDYAQYSQDEVAQAVMEGVMGLFSTALAVFAVPEAAEGGVLKALEAFKKVYEQIQAVMKVLQALQAVEATVAKDTASLNALSGQISSLSSNLQMPSQVDLQMVSQNVQDALANVPETDSTLKQDKADLITAVNSLVIIGTALIEAQSKASQIQMQLINTNRLKTINSQQGADMTALAGYLHLDNSTRPPDLNSINLIGVTGQLQYQLKQVLLILAQTLEAQDGAIQYEYFGQPTEITSFSLLKLLTVISTQDQNIINGITALNPQPQAVTNPITITIKSVLATNISGTNVFQFPINLSETEFYDYDMVRIDRVVPRISGIKSTTGGNYEVHLFCQGRPFQDRDYQRKPRTYTTVGRSFGPYVYDVATGDAEFGTNVGTFAANVTPLTPFSLWQISLPNSVQNNQGIAFDGLTVDVEIDFYITAHYDDPAQRQAALLQTARASGSKFARALATLDTDSSGATLTALETQMYNDQAVLQGWDAVFNILDGPVNAFLNQQFQAYLAKLQQGATTNLMTINTSYCQGLNPYRGTWLTTVMQMEFQLSNPLLQFLAGNSNYADVSQYIVSGVVNSGSLEVDQNSFVAGNCNLPPNLYSISSTFTANATTGILTIPVGAYLANGLQVTLSSSGTLPAPLAAGTNYWIINWNSSNVNQSTLQLAASEGGSPIALTSAGSGTCAIAPVPSTFLNFTANATTGVLTLSQAGYLSNGIQVLLSSSGTLPAPLVAGTDYWVVNWTNANGQTTLQLSATAGGTPIALTSAGSGTCAIAPDVYWGQPMQVDTVNNPYISCNVPLNKVTGAISPITFTVADGAAGTLAITPVGALGSATQVTISSTGTLPAPLAANTNYWVVNWNNTNEQTTLQLAASAGGTPIALTNTGSGTMTVNPNTLSVVLDFTSGSFTFKNFSVQPNNWDPSGDGTQISNALANFYTVNDMKYQIQTIDLTNLSADPDLTPTAFVLNAATTNSGNNVLQVLIATTGTVQNSHSINVNEPIPYDPSNPVPGLSDYTVSLMISTKLMFQHIFVDSFNKGGSNIQVAAQDPGNDYTAWYAYITQGSATAAATFSNPYNVQNTQVNYRISESSNNITWPLTGLQFLRQASGGLQLNYTNGSATNPTWGGQEVDFQYQEWQQGTSTPNGGYVPGQWGPWTDASAMAYITMTGNYPLGVSGSGRSQVVTFTNTTPAVTFAQSSDLTPTSGCQCNDNDIKIALMNALGDSVPAALEQYMNNITFTPISTFALESLLFPADQLITMQVAQVPGDLLVVGDFLGQVRQTNSTYNVTISAAAGAQGIYNGTTFINGTSVNSVTKNGEGNSVTFTYGPAATPIGQLPQYVLDLTTGAITTGGNNASLFVVVVQPDPVNNPQTVTILPPGYVPSGD